MTAITMTTYDVELHECLLDIVYDVLNGEQNSELLYFYYKYLSMVLADYSSAFDIDILEHLYAVHLSIGNLDIHDFEQCINDSPTLAVLTKQLLKDKIASNLWNCRCILKKIETINAKIDDLIFFSLSHR